MIYGLIAHLIGLNSLLRAAISVYVQYSVIVLDNWHVYCESIAEFYWLDKK